MSHGTPGLRTAPPGCVGKPGGQGRRIAGHVSSSLQFEEVSDLVARFETLVSTKAALKLEEQKRLVEMESTRAQLLSLQSEKQDEMLNLNQQRTQLVEELEAAREHRQQWVRVPGGPPTLLVGVGWGGG